MSLYWQKAVVSVLIVVFASSSWLNVNAVFVELPLMVGILPEGWNLPSVLSIIVQLAIVGPLSYGLLDKFLHIKKLETFIYVMLTVGCVSTVFMAFLWDVTAVIAESQRSVALYFLFFVFSLIDCTSNVVFLPYMSKFKHQYITVYFLGMGFSGLIPSILALIQGAGNVECVTVVTGNNSNSSVPNNISVIERSVPPNFGVKTFNFIIALFMCLAFVAFICLNVLQICKNETLAFSNRKSVEEKETANVIAYESGTPGNANDLKTLTPFANGQDEQPYLLECKCLLNNARCKNPTCKRYLLEHSQTSARDKQKLSLKSYISLLFITSVVCCLMNGVLPSIQTFSALPYGLLTYHLTAALSNLANPLACFIPFFVTVKSAASSPLPILVGTIEGSALTVIMWILTFGGLAYIRTVSAGLLGSSGRKKALFWCGAASQIGSFVGAMILFPLVNIMQLFKSAPSCPLQQTALA